MQLKASERDVIPEGSLTLRYAYAITAGLLIAGTAATLMLPTPLGAQVAQNEPGSIQPLTAPRAGAPMSFADMVAKLQPAVVNISTKQRVRVTQGGNPFAGTPFEGMFGQQGGGGGDGRPVTREGASAGSGFLISADGYIVTNNHVVTAEQRGATVETVTVTLIDRKEYVARVIGRDAESDLAVLKIDAQNLPFVKFGDSTKTRVGDWVIAIGNPFAIGSTVTAGIVSAVHRTGLGGPQNRLIQTDASINQGNSGGPMFDMNGNVIGINSQIVSPTGGSVGIGFAIPSEQAAGIIQSLRGGARVQRGYLGIGIQPLDEGIADSLGLPKNAGELVRSVEPGQGAAKAGIRQGDVIVKVNNREVNPDETLSFIVAGLPVGSRVPIELIRDGRRQTVSATLGQRPTQEQLAKLSGAEDGSALENDGTTPGVPSANAVQQALGLSVQPLTPALAQRFNLAPTTRGVIVASVDPSSDAAARGIRQGDVISSAGGRTTVSPADLVAGVNAANAAGRSSVLLYVQRGGDVPRFIGVKLANK
jgi:serine protease Do